MISNLTLIDLRVCRKLDEIYSPTILVQFGASVVAMCVASVVMVRINNTSSKSNNIWYCRVGRHSLQWEHISWGILFNYIFTASTATSLYKKYKL